MQLVIIRKKDCSSVDKNGGLLRFAISSEPLFSLILHRLSSNLWLNKHTITAVAIPEDWGVEPRVTAPEITRYKTDIPVRLEAVGKNKRDSWFAISDGRFATRISKELLDKMLASVRADVVLVNVESELSACREKVRLTTEGKVAGFRRLYRDTVGPAPNFANWPHHIFIKTNVLDRALAKWRLSANESRNEKPSYILPQSFSAFIKNCRSNRLRLYGIHVGGSVLDLDTEDGMLSYCKDTLSCLPNHRFRRISQCARNNTTNSNGMISQSSRLIGKVLLGKDVRIGPDVIIVGPAIIGDGVRIEQGAVIASSIIGPGFYVPQKQLVQNRVVEKGQNSRETAKRYENRCSEQPYRLPMHTLLQQQADNVFRYWPRFSYARLWKRIADCFAAIIVLVLFAPIIPFIALAIKLNSAGTVFFKDKRQGLHGKEFHCLKFRTMVVGADKIQDKLRVVNQMDGPQFKIKDDPRISAVGRFLRDTYIDEIPQFLNVLLGQMSVVGPRPSPKSENMLCPYWRDARLSVRPGITGLWQVCRTRQPMKDFQEWNYYDTKYVRNLSLKLDLWICWQTTKKLVKNFIRQF